MTHPKLFGNLAVEDLERSVELLTNLGFSFDEHFADETATCMVIGEDAYAMLLTKPRFAEFTTKPICDCTAHMEVMLGVSADSREAVDHVVDAAIAAGGSPPGETEEHGFTYARSFHDPGGHHWEVVWMDSAGVARAVEGAVSTR